MAKPKANSANTEMTKTISKDEFVQGVAKMAGDKDLRTAIDGGLDLKTMFQAARNVDVKELSKVAGDDYFELEEGETYIFICTGLVENALPSKKDPSKLVNAVGLINEEGIESINADVVLVSTVTRVLANNPNKFPCAIQIHVKDELKKSAAGEYKDLEIYLY